MVSSDPHEGPLPSSFRDSSGFLFRRGGTLYRQVNQRYREDYDRLMKPGGLYDRLIEDGLLIAHTEADISPCEKPECYKVIQPQLVGFISYPYEWSFSQLKDAAKLTLKIQRLALDQGMSLKDCSAYNVQFHQGRPVFIDTLSFEPYPEGSPWVAYRQFCQHFLAPLALMHYRSVHMNQLLRTNIDGIPLELASRLLPGRTWWRFGLLSHLHLHARSQRRYADSARDSEGAARSVKLSKFRLIALIDNLQSVVDRLCWRPKGTEWSDYYDNTNYVDKAMACKRSLIEDFVTAVKPHTVWDLGGNTGVFSRAAVKAMRTLGRDQDNEPPVVCFDIDPAAVEKNYRSCRGEGRKDILPLVLDLTNPSPGLGWHHRERDSLVGRGPVDMVMALALVHHLAISNNLPFDRIAAFMHSICRSLVIEFVPKADSQVRRLLATREDIFLSYDKESFEKSFGRFFTIDRAVEIEASQRTLFLMTARELA